MATLSAPREVLSSSAVLSIDDGQLKEEYEKVQAWGLLGSIDLHKCHPDYIKNPEKIRQFILELCDRIDMVRHGDCLVERFGQGDIEGYSAFQFIETSSVMAHFDEKLGNNAYIDVFSCKYFNPKEAAEFAKEFFEAEDYVLTYTLRK